MSVQSAWRIGIRQALLKGWAGWQPWGLPVEFPAELDASGGIGRSDGSEIAIAQIGVWLEEVRMIERVEHFEAELDFSRLAEAPPFFDAHVVVEEFGGSQIRQESRSIAKCVGRRLGKCRWIDPICDGLILRNRIDSRDQVGSLIESESACVVCRRIDGERQSGSSG